MGDGEQFAQRCAGLGEIRKRVAVEYFEKAVTRLVERALQHAASLDRADVVADVAFGKTGDERHVGLGVTNDLAENDRARRLREPQAAAPPAYRLYITGNAKLMGDFHQMVLGDAVLTRDLGDGRKTIFLDRETDQ